MTAARKLDEPIPYVLGPAATLSLVAAPTVTAEAWRAWIRQRAAERFQRSTREVFDLAALDGGRRGASTADDVAVRAWREADRHLAALEQMHRDKPLAVDAFVGPKATQSTATAARWVEGLAALRYALGHEPPARLTSEPSPLLSFVHEWDESDGRGLGRRFTDRELAHLAIALGVYTFSPRERTFNIPDEHGLRHVVDAAVKAVVVVRAQIRPKNVGKPSSESRKRSPRR